MTIEAENTAPKEREAEELWEEVIAEASRQAKEQGIPANRVEWSKGIERPGRGKFRMNLKPMFINQNHRIALIVSSLYKDKDHIELCVAIAAWNGDSPRVLSVIASPVGPLTSLELNTLEFGKYASQVVKIGSPKAPFFPQSDARPN